MTIIAYRDGIMVADSQVSKGPLRYGTYEKIRRLSDGSFFAAAGLGDDCEGVFRWLEKGGAEEKPKVESAFTALIVRPGYEFPHEMEEALRERDVRAPYVAIGENFAVSLCIGAMAMGATAAQAVAIAIEHSVWVGGAVQVVDTRSAS